ncbi:inversin protein alternative isoform, putative [hydrothermal vent metagenome]|uniref:Inversin protein alternative isoform, putative n=1 Tax=hydrothermal vent metagenome TaxID=652676 RepID=A0A1W1C6N0_9ZZZZ
MNSNEVMKQVEELVYNNDIEGFKKLMDSLEDVNLQDKYGWTPLHLAIRRGREEMVRYLVEEKGADINIQDTSGWTPLMEAIMDDFEEIVKYLVQKGADLSIANARGVTAPVLAQKFERTSMQKYLS